MKKNFKSLLNIIMIVSIIFTMVVGISSQNNIVLANQTDEELKEKPLEEIVREEIKEEPKKEEVLEEPEKDNLVEHIPLEEDGIAENYPPSNSGLKLVFPNVRSQRLLSTLALTDSIKVDKTAKRSPGCRTFEVTLGITGTPPIIPVDIVLVIDRSGSMNALSNDYVEITGTPDTSKSYYVLINQAYQEVTYSSGSGSSAIWIYQSGGTTQNPTYRYVKFNASSQNVGAGGSNKNNPVGKKFYNRLARIDFAKQAAVNFAAKVLGSNGIPGSRVSIVSFSGPETTNDNGAQNQATTDQQLTSDLNKVNTAIDKITAIGGTNTQAGFLQGRDEITSTGSQQNPDSNKVVIMFTDGLPTASNGAKYKVTTDINHSHVKSAIAAGKGIFNDNKADVFTVGLLQEMTSIERNLAIDILEQTKNKEFYEAPTAADLGAIFNSISENLGYSAKDAVVVDRVGAYFKPVLPLPAGASYDVTTNKITWNAGSIGTSKEYKYIVQAIPTFVGGMAFTNEEAILTYTDVDKVTNKTKTFPKPNVNVPTLLTVILSDANIISGESITLGMGKTPSGPNYMSNITGGDGDGNYSYEWRVKGNNTVISTTKNPVVKPTKDTIYELTVIDSNGCKAIAEMNVKVTDKLNFGIKKIDKNTGELLDGARFILKKELVEVDRVDTIDGYAWPQGLLPGTYTLQEIKAPERYRLNNTEYTIKILQNGEMSINSNSYASIVNEGGKKVIVVKNEQKAVLPNTGGPGSVIMTIVGVGLISISYILYKKRYI